MFGGSLSELRKYDVLATFPITGVQVTYECKRDRMAWMTGNVAVEHKALLHSEADFIVYMLDQISDDLYQVGRQSLIDRLTENWIGAHLWKTERGKEYWLGSKGWVVTTGGQFQDWMTLVSVKKFVQICNPI